MRSLWDEAEAAGYPGDLGQRVYSSRLLGREPALVLHGGGNTSVKVREPTLLGEEEILYVKGSGWDLATIEREGFAPVRMRHLLALAELEELSDVQMAKELRAAQTDASAPSPSVEAILHAVLPHRFVDHTHADAVIAVTNTPSGEQHVRECYGDAVVVLPYVMPGFALARLAAERVPVEAREGTIGMVLLRHGIFSFGGTARESYERMIELVTRAEDYLRARGAWELAPPAVEPPMPVARELVELRAAVSAAAGRPLVLRATGDARGVEFAQREDVRELAEQGPATPDHVTRTKRVPLVGRDVERFADEYRDYFEEHARGRPLQMLDPAPRVVLDPGLGLCVAGRTAAEAAIVGDIYRQTIDVILRASALERWEALSPAEVFDVEYWSLEQAKLDQQGSPPVFTGEVALVTGAASGIGRGCVDALLARGAAVVGLDLNPEVVAQLAREDGLGVQCDVGSEEQVAGAIEAAVRRFGGVDMLILCAGVFPASSRLEALDLDAWRDAMHVNLDANALLLRTAHPFLTLAPRGGRVVVIGSKNVRAPGPGAAAYSASKAALNQLARVAALEWGGDGIRVNVIHPDAVFDTGIWTEEVLRARAEHYELSIEEYKRRNVLHVDIASRDVGELAAELCGPVFAKTTGAQVPIDGGNDRVI